MSVSESVVSPFNRLLNSISDKLSPQNLQSLIHICETYIPESRREEIRYGLDVFRILKQQNVIGDDAGEKIQNLEQIVRAMRPKRRDIIKKVGTFIRTHYDAGHEFLSSGESNVFYHSQPAAVLVDNHRQPPPLDQHNSASDRLESLSGSQIQPSNEVIRSTENHCTIDCCCLGCKCYARQIPSCVLLILTGIMAIMTFLATVLWFGEMPKKLYNMMSHDVSHAGAYVVGCCGVVTLGFLFWWIYRKVHGNRHVFHIPYQNFTNPVDLPVTPSTVAEKCSTNPPATVDLPNNQQKRRPFGSVPAQSSLETAASASLMDRREQRRHHLNSLTGDDVSLQTDGACASGETDEFQSRESLFPVDSSSDYSIDEPTVPPMTAE